jgi:Cdc6-like AAA superfamily ATPase
VSSEGSVAFQGIGAKVVSTVNKSEIPVTKDDIVEELSKVIRRLKEAGDRVVVGIDELDKLDVDDEGTTRLLNAMKSLFAITSASFLITISTSAWSSFEQRGIRVRTVFDSSFDDIVEARALSFLDARSLVKRRQVALSDSQILFVNVAAGGIARDLLRYGRKLIEIGESDEADLNLGAACATFIEQERATALEAAVLDARDRLEPLDAERVIYRLELLGRL